ncbi:MAG: beta-ketoacyl synthase N-terminal-like domain-containing protein [Acidobacteriota bacterium]
MTHQMDPGVPAYISGLATISVFGPSKGLPSGVGKAPARITSWPTTGARRAFLIEPFRPAEVVPGLKTRRLDRLSTWSLVAASLALQDAGIDLGRLDRSMFGVVLGTGYGCLELSEAYLVNIGQYGYAKSDPIIFPETLPNSPAGHIARQFGLTGPNLAVTMRGISGEAAIIHAASLVRSGDAERVLVVAGDTLTRTLYEWYEAGRMLSPACKCEAPGAFRMCGEPDGLVPGEGIAALVLESEAAHAARRAQKVYARFLGGRIGGDPHATAAGTAKSGRVLAALAEQALGGVPGATLRLIVSSMNGLPAHDLVEREAISELRSIAPGARVLCPKSCIGELDAGGLLGLAAALAGLGEAYGDAEGAAASRDAQAGGDPGMTLLLGTSAGGGCAAVAFR